MSVKSSSTLIIFVLIFGRILLMRHKYEENNVLISIRTSGYQGELHHTITEDGFILGLQRIIAGPNDATRTFESRPPVLILHGLESSAIDWVHFLGNQSLPYLLFEKGYDVWLGNVRGTVSSYNHTILDPSKEKFWDTSVNEVGYYDLAAMVDYVLSKSNYEKLFYIGMSQGEASFLVLTSSRPEYNDKFKLALLTSPSSHLKHSDNSLMKVLAKNWKIIQRLAEFFRVKTVPGRDVIGKFCQYEALSRFCRYISSPFIGYSDFDQVSLETTTKLYQIYPTNSALKQFLHYLQMYNSGIFRRYDYGPRENFRRYGQAEPPAYDLRRITTKVAYFWGENDCWARPKDMVDIERKLPNMLNFKIPYKLFNHFDVMVGKDVKKMAYDPMIRLIEDHTDFIKKNERLIETDEEGLVNY